jgi:hypothetical protein
MPSGKANIISREAWRSRLPHLIAIESRRAPFDDCSDTERRELITSARRTRVSYEINIRSLRLLAKPGTQPLTREGLRTFRHELREAAEFYQVDHAASLPTPTERRKHLNAVKKTAVRLLAKPESGAWALRLAGAIRAADGGTRKLLIKALAKRTGERLGRLEALLGALDSVGALAGVVEGAASRQTRFAAKWLPRVRVLATINVRALVPTRTRSPDPPLGSLVIRLSQLWERTTGYSLVSMSKNEQHRLGDWVGKVVYFAGFPSPPEWSVWRIVEAEKKKNKVPARSPHRMP